MRNCASGNLEILRCAIAHRSSSLSRRPGMTKRLFRRTRPRPLRTAQALERLRHAEHAEIVEAAAADLHADRKSPRANAPVDRPGWIFRQFPRNGVAAIVEWFSAAVD